MKLQTLKMLVWLAEYKSFSIVAKQLDLTQPAVSMQIKSLEEQFETNLITRQKGNIELTPAGKIIYHQAKKILNDWEEAKLKVKQIKGKTYDHLTIGASTIPSEYLLPNLLAKFYNKLPEVETTVEVGDSKEIINLLKNKKIDLAIVGLKPAINQLQIKPIVTDSLVLIVPPDHRLANKRQVNSKELITERILLREKGSGTRQTMLTALENNGINKESLNIRACLGSNEAIISAVAAKLGISFISNLAAKNATLNNRIEKIEVTDISTSRKFYLAYYHNREKELLIKEFNNLCC
ncbi:transcriptional regulator [Halobacteroides halobius DSM 5150]|uniref:Transcriptional regulator n=1 Tax=Halobacteroides halobius (strain ATCC 35273 / DSM 5150 / MD-1) TaxID=748449 RepID=L0KCF9_HALHC|nr:selenium metabolism-associated LysR family transcriptional regulator [Halobacteroides halobius]AGB42064.1 transcriptional regulator [Halobacteroides halobius DSM 5150]